MSKSPIDAKTTYGKVNLDVAAELDGQVEARLADLRSGEAWVAFADAVKQVGLDMLASDYAANDRERANGVRYLLGLMVMRINRLIYACGPDEPAFTRHMDDILVAGLDNPDGINSKSAEVRDDRVYRLYGRYGGERYVELIQTGARGTLANAFFDEFEIGPDGRFEIVLGGEKRGGNWVPLAEGVRGLSVRQIQYDWDAEGYTEIHIERIGGGEHGPPQCLVPPAPERVAAELRAMARTLPSEFRFWQDYTDAFRREGDNAIPSHQPLAMSGVSKVRAAPKGFFALDPGEALLLEFDDPGGLFWSVAVGDTWFRTFNPAFYHTSLNGHQAHRDADGRYRVVIAHEDPGIANWLDTLGQRRGNMIFRFVRTESRPEPTITFASLPEILAMLPDDTARVSAEQRAETVARRAAAYSRRYAEPFTTRWSRFS